MAHLNRIWQPNYSDPSYDPLDSLISQENLDLARLELNSTLI
jgi:hypothetical protein